MGEGFPRHSSPQEKPQEKEPVQVIPEMEATLEGFTAKVANIEQSVVSDNDEMDDIAGSGLNSVQEKELSNLISRLREEKE